MSIFLGAEIAGGAAGRWSVLQKELTPLLKDLDLTSYGEGLTHIGVITILMPEEFFEDGGYKERRLYRKKDKEADIRLRLPYKEFMKADKQTKRTMYITHILESVAIAGEKAGKDYDTQRLLDDIKQLMNT